MVCPQSKYLHLPLIALSKKGNFFKNKFILISRVELHVPSMPIVPAAIEMKVMDPVVPCEYKSDTMNLMPQLSK